MKFFSSCADVKLPIKPNEYCKSVANPRDLIRVSGVILVYPKSTNGVWCISILQPFIWVQNSIQKERMKSSYLVGSPCDKSKPFPISIIRFIYHYYNSFQRYSYSAIKKRKSRNFFSPLAIHTVITHCGCTLNLAIWCKDSKFQHKSFS